MRRFSSFGSLGKQIAGLMEGRSEHTSQSVGQSQVGRSSVVVKEVVKPQERKSFGGEEFIAVEEKIRRRVTLLPCLASLLC